jgi:hypothetical protein
MKKAEPSNPLEFTGTEVAGELQFLARCLIEEYARLGYNADDLFLLFNQPSYQVTNQVLTSQGEPWVRRLIDEVLAEIHSIRG